MDACRRCGHSGSTVLHYQPECQVCGHRPLAALTDELEAELARAMVKHPTSVRLPDGTGDCGARRTNRAIAQNACERAQREGRLTHAHVLEEEVTEALAESDPALLRKELIQVGAMVLKWVRDIDSRERV